MDQINVYNALRQFFQQTEQAHNDEEEQLLINNPNLLSRPLNDSPSESSIQPHTAIVGDEQSLDGLPTSPRVGQLTRPASMPDIQSTTEAVGLSRVPSENAIYLPPLIPHIASAGDQSQSELTPLIPDSSSSIQSEADQPRSENVVTSAASLGPVPLPQDESSSILQNPNLEDTTDSGDSVNIELTGAEESVAVNIESHDEPPRSSVSPIFVEAPPPPLFGDEPPSSSVSPMFVEAPPPRYLPIWKCVMLGVYSFSGTTLLSAPYAVMEGGWISIIFLPLIALLASWSALLLGDCLSAQVTSYEGVGAAAFPQFGRLFIKVTTSIFSYITCIGIMIVQMDNLDHLFPKFGHLLTWILLVILLIVAWIFKNVTEENAWINGAGVMFILLATLLLGFCWIEVGGFSPNSEKLNLSKIHITFGFYVYFIASHGSLPVIHKSLSVKQNYRKIVIWIMVITSGLYIVTAFMGYAVYGRDVERAYTLNLPASSALCNTIIAFIGLDHFLRYILNITLVVRELVGAVSQTWEHRNTYQIFVRFIAVLITILPAVLYNYHDELYVEILTFGGAILGVLLAFVIPAVCFLKINWSIGITRKQGTFAGIVLLAGIAGATLTTVKSIKDWKS